MQPYQFIIPPTWKQIRIANILSGNYCQPKCAEPWVEVKFEDEKQGKVQVVASPLIRLTNKPNASIQDIGNPEKLIASLGPFVTGNTYDPDELLETSVEKLGDQTVQFFLPFCFYQMFYSLNSSCLLDSVIFVFHLFFSFLFFPCKRSNGEHKFHLLAIIANFSYLGVYSITNMCLRLLLL